MLKEYEMASADPLKVAEAIAAGALMTSADASPRRGKMGKFRDAGTPGHRRPLKNGNQGGRSKSRCTSRWEQNQK